MVVAGSVGLESIHDFAPPSGPVISWHPSPDSLDKARQAPSSCVPVSHQQARHLRNFRAHATRGVEMARLCIFAWELPGRCDVRAMTYVLNTHFRRHDTYHSWFEFGNDDQIVRHTVLDPANIEFVPTKYGEMTPKEWQAHLLAAPSPLQWDCFRFAVIQHADSFTCCIAIDHLHIDLTAAGVFHQEIDRMYAALIAGKPPLILPAAGSYEDYCVRQRKFTSKLTLESSQVRRWVEFFDSNNGSLPSASLPLGDGLGAGDIIGVQLMDERQTAQFEAACIAAGTRFSGGVFACAALAEHQLTGVEKYYGLVAADTRSTPAEFMTTGWFTGFVPITIPIEPSSFSRMAHAAQTSFDLNSDLAHVPFDRILELAPWLKMPPQRVPLLFHVDVGVLAALATSELGGSNPRIFRDGGVPARLDIRVHRLKRETHAGIFFPNNPVARESVKRYLAVLKSIYAAVVENFDRASQSRQGQSNSLCA
ncbi:MAG: acyltransferase [Mycobacteriaceae bacterium]|nr:acyltransferase [Mycobacteriaceae bacterium]